MLLLASDSSSPPSPDSYVRRSDYSYEDVMFLPPYSITKAQFERLTGALDLERVTSTTSPESVTESLKAT